MTSPPRAPFFDCLLHRQPGAAAAIVIQNCVADAASGNLITHSKTLEPAGTMATNSLPIRTCRVQHLGDTHRPAPHDSSGATDFYFFGGFLRPIGSSIFA